MPNTTNYTIKEKIGIKLFNIQEKNYFKGEDGQKIIGRLKRLLATARTKKELEALHRFILDIDKINNYNDLKLMINTFNKSLNIYRKPEGNNEIEMELKVNSRSEINNEINRYKSYIEIFQSKINNYQGKNRNAVQELIKSNTKRKMNLEKVKNSGNKSLIDRESRKIIKIRLLNKINSIKNKYDNEEIVSKLMEIFAKIDEIENYYFFENFLDSIMYLNLNKNKVLENINDYQVNLSFNIEHL